MHDIVSKKVMLLEQVLTHLMQRIAFLEEKVASTQSRREAILAQATSSVPDDL